jgi:hypothetical protein
MCPQCINVGLSQITSPLPKSKANISTTLCGTIFFPPFTSFCLSAQFPLFFLFSLFFNIFPRVAWQPMWFTPRCVLIFHGPEIDCQRPRASRVGAARPSVWSRVLALHHWHPAPGLPRHLCGKSSCLGYCQLSPMSEIHKYKNGQINFLCGLICTGHLTIS